MKTFFNCHLLRRRNISVKNVSAPTGCPETRLGAIYDILSSTHQYVLGDNVQMLANYITDRSNELQFSVPGFSIKRNVRS
jgi:hypothetical protein